MSSLVAFVTYIYKNQDKLRVQLRNMQGSRQMNIWGTNTDVEAQILPANKVENTTV